MPSVLNLQSPTGYSGQPATNKRQGVMRFATDAEADAGVANNLAVTPIQLQSVSIDLSSPPPIGDVTPNSGAFSDLTVISTNDISLSTALNLNLSGESSVGLGSPVSITLDTPTTDVTGVLNVVGDIQTSTGDIEATLGDVAAGGDVIAGVDFRTLVQGRGLIVISTPAVSGAAASPIVIQGRTGTATFTSVSIAAGADLTLTITNADITDASTVVMIDWSGATTGSALSVKSKTSSTGSLAIVMTNGTGATTSTSSIKIDFMILN